MLHYFVYWGKVLLFQYRKNFVQYRKVFNQYGNTFIGTCRVTEVVGHSVSLSCKNP